MVENRVKIKDGITILVPKKRKADLLMSNQLILKTKGKT